MNTYFKLNLNNSYYWQCKDGIYKKKKFVKKQTPEENYLYLQLFEDGSYAEFFSGKNIRLDDDFNVCYPKGVNIDMISNLTPCSYLEIKAAFYRMKKNGVLDNYMVTLKDIFVHSGLCELAVAKKKNKKGFSLLDLRQ